MRQDYDTADDCLLDCGDIASKKVGRVWMCDFHYATFHSVGERHEVAVAVDSRDLNEDE